MAFGARRAVQRHSRGCQQHEMLDPHHNLHPCRLANRASYCGDFDISRRAFTFTLRARCSETLLELYWSQKWGRSLAALVDS